MFLCLKTATSIGYNPKPDNTGEYFFMTVYWLSGVFVFAMLLGQVRDIFQAASERKLSYRRTMDDTLDYMHQLHLPKELQRKVRLWFNYTWEKNKALGELKSVVDQCLGKNDFQKIQRESILTRTPCRKTHWHQVDDFSDVQHIHFCR